MLKKDNPENLGFDFEDQACAENYSLVIGIDEAGRGPLAGPVVASAVALKTRSFSNKVCDSKKISPQQRIKTYHEILDKAFVGVGVVSESVIDHCNILQATFLAMANAVRDLLSQVPPVGSNKVKLLIDGNRFNADLNYPYQTVIKGDQVCFSIACASIIAKVTRDRILCCYHKVFPQYGFERHKGYPTKAHRQAIKEFGLSLIHRKTFCSGL